MIIFSIRKIYVKISIRLTFNRNTPKLAADYFPLIVLESDYFWGLVSFDTYRSIPNIDFENNLFHIGNRIIQITVGSYEFSNLADFLIRKYKELNVKGKLKIE